MQQRESKQVIEITPKLVALAGPLQGTVFSLTELECAIGRESSNQLCLSDLSVSRQHCRIHREADLFILRDLESLNCTFVNGVPVRERQLVHGDQLRIGDSLFLFLRHEEETRPTSAPVQLDDGRLIPCATVLLRQADAPQLQAEKLLAEPPSRLMRDFDVLLKISTAINSTSALEPLARHLLELIGSVIPAERGAILLAEEGSEDFTSAVSWRRQAGAQPSFQVSRTVVRQVLEQGVALLSCDLLERDVLSAAPSLVASNIQSLLAVPLQVCAQVIGFIYLDTRDPAMRFDEDHLRLLSAVAGMAAVALEQAGRLERLERENRRLREEIHLEHDMIGESPRMREVYQFLAKVAPTDSTVLIRGESGTGKELAARALHRNSPRAAKPFVAINCAALAETLLESELFGHERGAFTGAIAQKKGKLELAEGGTLFLDEMGELAPPLQAKLLRVLQEREFERVGGTRPIKADVRVIAATNRDLEGAIAQSSFRQDLYFRLNVVSLRMPPLRERREDIPLLAGYFVAKYSQRCKRQVRGISAQARTRLLSYDWPGNVRELENAIERAVVLGSTDFILPEDLPEAVLEAGVLAEAGSRKLSDLMKEAKKLFIRAAIEQAGGNITKAAELLDVHPNHLHWLIRTLKLKPTLKPGPCVLSGQTRQPRMLAARRSGE
jgi:Nif-specific regulatory protein